jgi:hypothetical protein
MQTYDIAENTRSFMPAATPLNIMKTLKRMAENLP